MDIELIDRTWACLPKEFKEEVNEIYLNAVVRHPCGYNHKTDLLKYLFGYHNLTSDVEGEEMLTVPRKKVQRAYNTSREIVKAENPDSLMYSMHTQIMCVLENIFGSKCLPNAREFNFVSIEPKPAEPKFKIGDKVRVKFNAKELHSNPDPSKNIYYWQTTRDKYLGKVFKITDIWKSGTITLNTAEVMFWEPFDLEPYTEQREDLIPPNSGELESQQADKQFNTIIKDSLAKERRLNIAAQIVASMVGSDDWTTWRGDTKKEIWHNMAKSSLEIADALIAECETSY